MPCLGKLSLEMARTKLTFATGPVRLGYDGVRMRSGLQSVLSNRFGTLVDVVATASYSDLLAHLASGVVHLAWMSPGLGVYASDKIQSVPLMSAVRAAGQEFFGTLFVREDSPIVTAEDIRGTRVGWVDSYSCSGYLFPRMALKARGFDLRGFFANQHMFGSHEEVARAVEAGDIDVGATYINVSPGESGRGGAFAGWGALRGVSMRPVVRSEPIPSDLIVAHRRLDEKLMADAVEIFATLHEDAEAARVANYIMGSERFEKVDIRRYDVVRTALAL